jgi:GNAT superfamily N-acetyltransferase
VDDLDDLLLLWSQSREEMSRSLRPLVTLPADQLRPRLHETLMTGESTVLLARYDGAPAGYGVVRVAPVLAVDPLALHIDQLYVAPSLRRRGVAHALLVAAIGIAERSGADQVVASAPPGVRDTHRFLARLGFSPLVVRRVTATAALRRRLAGEGQRRGLEDLLSRRRSLRARAARSGWPGGGRVSGSRQGADQTPESDEFDTGGGLDPSGVERSGRVVIADCLAQRIDLGGLEAAPLPPGGAVGERSGRPAGQDVGLSVDQDTAEASEVPGRGRRHQRA